MDLKQRLIGWRAVFNNSPKYSEMEQKAAEKITDLCHELPDNDNEKIALVRIAVNFSNNTDKVKILLKKLIELTDNCDDISEKMGYYRTIINHKDVDPEDKSNILHKMVTILESYDQPNPALPSSLNEVIQWSSIAQPEVKPAKGKKTPKSRKPTKPEKSK